MKRLLWMVLGTLALWMPMANAQIFLKPESFKAHALRVQHLRIETRLVGPFALTKVSITSTPETGSQNIAAQLIASKPPGASVIDFSFESGQEYSGGRVVKNG